MVVTRERITRLRSSKSAIRKMSGRKNEKLAVNGTVSLYLPRIGGARRIRHVRPVEKDFGFEKPPLHAPYHMVSQGF